MIRAYLSYYLNDLSFYYTSYHGFVALHEPEIVLAPPGKMLFFYYFSSLQQNSTVHNIAQSADNLLFAT